MIRIAGGTFQMGDTVEDDEKPIHPVTVSTFYLAETELSFAQYDFYCEQTGRKMPNDEGWGRDNRPVINVSWDDAQSYIQWLNAQPGQSGWRLPTEAEWEYAAGGGASVRTQWAGTDSERYLGNYAIYNTNKTSSVKSKRVHGELYDMSGNVREWCLDWYGRDYYVDSPASNPQGPSTGTERVLRGGGWSSYADKCRVASRRGHWPDYRIRNIGFRLARSL
ncbi:MAG: formylglycine-generating enzyme family protein [Bacteroidota bacterium]